MIIIVHLFYQASSKRRNKRCRQYQKDLEMGRQRLKAERATCTFKATRTYQLHAVSLRVSQNQRVTANFNFQQPRVAYILTGKSHTPPRDRWTRGCSLLIFFFLGSNIQGGIFNSLLHKHELVLCPVVKGERGPCGCRFYKLVFVLFFFCTDL